MNRIARFDQEQAAQRPGEPLRIETLLLHVDPRLAREYLGTCRGGRPYRPEVVSRMVEDMVRGRWVINGVPLVFDRRGVLRDGQRRLLAVVLAGVAVPMLIVRGVEPEAADTIGSGTRRSLVDRLTAAGEAQPRLLAATLRLLGRFYSEDGLQDTPRQLTPDLLDLLAENPGIRASLATVRSLGWRRWAPVPALAAAHTLLSDLSDPARLSEFLVQLRSGFELQPGTLLLELHQAICERRSPSTLTTLDLIMDAFTEWLTQQVPGGIPSGEAP